MLLVHILHPYALKNIFSVQVEESFLCKRTSSLVDYLFDTDYSSKFFDVQKYEYKKIFDQINNSAPTEGFTVYGHSERLVPLYASNGGDFFFNDHPELIQREFYEGQEHPTLTLSFRSWSADG